MSHLLRTSRLLAWLFLTGLSVAVIVTSGFYLYLRPGLPPVHQLLDIKLQTPLRVYSKDNRLIAEFGEKRRTPITIEQIPTIQLQAFMAAEDARFYEHFGVDISWRAIELISTGEIQSGGSTITMQVAKITFCHGTEPLYGSSTRYFWLFRLNVNWTKTAFSSST